MKTITVRPQFPIRPHALDPQVSHILRSQPKNITAEIQATVTEIRNRIAKLKENTARLCNRPRC